MQKLGIVILNYLNYEDTIECVESLRKQTNQHFEIVIVDNFSQNSSYEVLKETYGQSEGIHILETPENLGYAKGNNVGIKYCKEQLGIYSVLVVNSDVIFTDTQYVDFLLNYEVGKNIGAVGTKIIGADGLNQNPLYTPTTAKRILKEAIYFTLEKWNVLRFYTSLKARLTKQQSSTNSESVPDQTERKSQEPYFLHGSAIYLTENYLRQVDGFYPETFLYYEENILAVVMDKMNLAMVYTDGAEIYHKEDQSSALSFGNNSKVRNKYLSESMWIAVKVKFSPLTKIKKTINEQRSIRA